MRALSPRRKRAAPGCAGLARLAQGAVGAAALLACAVASAQGRPFTLFEALDMALQANRQLVIARLATESEEYALVAAQSEFDLKVIPTATLGRIGYDTLGEKAVGNNNSIGLQLSKRLDTGASFSIGPSRNRYANASNTTLNVSLSQPLLRGFGAEVNREGIRRAEFSLDTARRAQQQASINTALETIGIYYEALKQAGTAELYEALAQRLKRHALVARGKEQVGLAGSMDTYRAEIRLKDAEDTANLARAATRNLLDRLKIVANLGLDVELALSAPPAPAVPLTDLESDAIATRIEFTQLRAELEEAIRAARLATKALLPDITLQVEYGQATTSYAVLAAYLPSTQRQWRFALQGSSDFSRVAEKNNLRRAQTRVDVLRMNLESKLVEVRRQVRQQQLVLSEARQRIALRREQIGQARGKLALAEVKFGHEMADNFDVIEAETEVERARGSLLATEADYAVGVYNLQAMTGHLFDRQPFVRHASQQ